MKSIANALLRGRWVVGLWVIPLLMASLYLTLSSPYDRRLQYR